MSERLVRRGAQDMARVMQQLQRFDHLPDAVAQMVHDCGVSPRQAYRYLQPARRLQQPVPIGDSKVAFTVKLSQDDFLHVEMLSRVMYVVVELFANAE